MKFKKAFFSISLLLSLLIISCGGNSSSNAGESSISGDSNIESSHHHDSSSTNQNSNNSNSNNNNSSTSSQPFPVNEKRINVSFYDEGGKEYSDIPKMNNVLNSSVKIPDTTPTSSGQYFAGWMTFDDDRLFRPGDPIPFEKDVKFFARFAKLCSTCKGRFSNIQPNFIDCSKCSGTGLVDTTVAKEEICPTCKGSKQITGDQTCSTCGGSKYTTTNFMCTKCHSMWSSPYTSPNPWCSYCKSGVYVKIVSDVSCTTCNGHGSVNGTFTCPKCEGTGIYKNYKIACTKCDGDGKVDGKYYCRYCNDEGYDIIQSRGEKVPTITKAESAYQYSRFYFDDGQYSDDGSYEYSFVQGFVRSTTLTLDEQQKVLKETRFYFNQSPNGSYYYKEKWTSEHVITLSRTMFHNFEMRTGTSVGFLLKRKKATATSPAGLAYAKIISYQNFTDLVNGKKKTL